MPSPNPPIDARSYDEVVSSTEALVRAYTKVPGEPASGFHPPQGSTDVGSALIRIFGRMTQQVIDRINRVPDRAFLSFLNLIGVAPSPPRPARVPLTFFLAKGTKLDAFVPKGTQVAAEPAATDPREVVFETEADLVVAQTELVAAFVRQPEGDLFTDCTSLAAGATPGFFRAFEGEAPVEHSLYLAADEILTLPALTVATLTLDFSALDLTTWHALNVATNVALMNWPSYAAPNVPPQPLITWSYWGGTEWKPLAATFAVLGTTQWRATFTLPSDLAASVVGGRTGHFLRAKLGAWPLSPIPKILGATFAASVTQTGLPPDFALTNGSPLDTSKDFFPLGERPRFNDTFHIASAEVFSRPGATVTLTVTVSPQFTPLVGTDDPTLAWEVYLNGKWVEAGRSTKTSDAVGQIADFDDTSLALTKGFQTAIPADGKIKFTLPQTVGEVAVSGTTARWVRARLVSGTYGKGIQLGSNNTVTDNGYRPPILTSVTLGYTQSPSALAVCGICGDGAVTFYEQPVPSGFQPYVRSSDADPTLYLGFSKPFANRPSTLFVQVAPLPPVSLDEGALGDPTSTPQIHYEYSTTTEFVALGADDQTRAFHSSGLIRFVGPSNFASTNLFGRTLFWIRARLAKGEFSSAARVGRVLTNTVWATHARTIENEVLGSSDQSASQAFSLTHTPVLRGQQLDVIEPEQLPPDEQAEVVRAEGEDAIVVQESGSEGALSTTSTAQGTAREIRVRWHAVTDFAGSGPRDRHYLIDHATGRIQFGDGRHGLPPPRGLRNVRALKYKSGGGAHGNQPPLAVHQLKTTVPYVDRVVNYEAAEGGADQEDLDRLKQRGPRVLRHGYRAVTADDFADLAAEASSSVARVKVVTPHFDPIQQADNPTAVDEAGHVLLLIVPSEEGRPPVPSLGLLRDIEAYIRPRCAPSVSLRLTSPDWVEVSVHNLKIVPIALEGADALRVNVTKALDQFLDPLTGGTEETGWQFGEIPGASDIYRLLSSIQGVDSIQSFTMVTTPTPPTGNKADRALIYPGVHSVEILPPEGGA